MLKKRILTVLWALPLLIAAIWFDQPIPWFTILMAVWGLAAVYEVYSISKTTAVPALTVFGLLWTALFIVSPHISPLFSGFIPLLLALMVMVPLIMLVLLPNKNGTFVSWAWMIASSLYIGWLLSYFVSLRGLDDGRYWVFVAFLTVFATDTAAYFIGRKLGKHKLAPAISPGKTWEGAIAGLIAGIAASVVFVILFGLPLNIGHSIVLGALVSILGQFGDLAESLFKRNIGVKDSGKLMAGHGGLLDRTDSIVFAGVVVYYYVTWVVV